METRKGFTIVLSLMVFFGTVIPGFAAVIPGVVEEKAVPTIYMNSYENDMVAREKEVKISKSQALEIAKNTLKDYFDYEIDEKKFGSTVKLREDYIIKRKYDWLIQWYMRSENENVNIDVWINSDTGKVKRLYKNEYDSNEDRPTIAQMTKEEAQVIADEFVRKINPEEYKEVKLQENRYLKYGNYSNYSFTYSRQINGIPFHANLISVEVDGIKGKVISYDYNWDDDVSLPSLDGIIDEVKAEEVIRDNINMNLMYIPIRDRGNSYSEKVNKAKLVYNTKFENGRMVDAKEGTMINYRKKSAEEERVKDISDERKEEIFKKAKAVKPLSKEVNNDRANQVIQRYVKGLYGDGYEIERLRYIENEDYWRTNGKKAWSATFTKLDGFKRHMDTGNITIDALTEQLITTNKYENDENYVEKGYTPLITWEEGYDKAIWAIENYFPEKIKDVDTKAKYRKIVAYRNGKRRPELEYYFNFQRKVDEIYYSQDGIHVEIDTKEGKIKELRCRWNEEVEFPKPAGIISKEDSMEIFFEGYEPELAYARINKSSDDENPDWEVKLVYREQFVHNRSHNIDAFRGKFLDYSGREMGKEDDRFNEKIKGHNAEKELSILASRGIINTKEFDLDKEVTRIEAIKMLVEAKGYDLYMVRESEDLKFSNITKDDDYYKYLQMAVKYGILENKQGKFKGDDKITREELAELMVKLLGYDKLANINEIFKVSYKDSSDISENRIGYVAICEGLEIIEGINRKFKPKNKVKIDDMAIAIYKSLGNLRK